MKRLFLELGLPVYNYFKSSEYREFVRLFGKLRKLPRYKAQNIKFINFDFFVPDAASFLGQFKEIFVEEIFKFISNKPDPIIYDCGSNIGLSCLYFKLLYPKAKITAFEADPNIFSFLCKNLEKNRIQNVRTVNKAVWDNDGTIDFGTDGADGGSVYLNTNRIKVESIKLSDWLKKETTIDFLKLDIEGAELEVLLDCQDTLKNAINVFIEYHSWNGQEQKLDKILDVLTKSGFRYYFHPVNVRKTPFINQQGDRTIDFQLNIFAHRKR